jgi:hypothetical protein
LYVTPAGDIIVAETKLWRNPQARREVVGQIIDYAKDLSAWNYEELEAAIRRTQVGRSSEKQIKLYDFVMTAGDAEIDEAQFIDAVSRNLRRGRLLLLIVGDGIQQGAENITAFLQQHAGLHFTLGLIELAVFTLPAGGYLVQPRILARTTNIDRGIVTIEDGRITVKPPSPQVTTTPVSRTTSISEERFYEELAKSHPNVPARLKAFVEQLSALGVTKDFGTKSMILRWRPDEARAWSLGAILTDGKVWTEMLHSQTDAVGLLDLSHAYVKHLASLVPGAYVKEGKPTSWHVDKDGTYVSVSDLLAHESGWYAAIQEFTAAAKVALSDQ